MFAITRIRIDQPDRELHADLGVVDRVSPASSTPTRSSPARNAVPAPSRIAALTTFSGVADLHDQAAEEGGEAEQVQDEQDQPQCLHGGSLLISRVPRSDRPACRCGAGRTTSTGHGA